LALSMMKPLTYEYGILIAFSLVKGMIKGLPLSISGLVISNCAEIEEQKNKMFKMRVYFNIGRYLNLVFKMV